MLLSWIMLVTLMGIYTINNNNTTIVHSKSTIIVPKTKRISIGNPRPMNLKAKDKFEQNIISKQKGLKISSNKGILMLFIICSLFLRHRTVSKPHLF